MPTLNDLYYTFIGNIKLKPEFTNQYNLGFTYAPILQNKWLKNIELQADVYYNEVKNKIVAVPTSNQFRWTMMNLGMVEIRGLDIAIQLTGNYLNNFLLIPVSPILIKRHKISPIPKKNITEIKYHTSPGTVAH